MFKILWIQQLQGKDSEAAVYCKLEVSQQKGKTAKKVNLFLCCMHKPLVFK